MFVVERGSGSNINPNVQLGDTEVQPELTDSISQLSWSKKSNHFVGTCWDNNIYCWEVTNNRINPVSSLTLDAPTLTCAWGDDFKTVFFGGCDNKGYMWDLQTNQMVQIAQHESPIKFIRYIPEKNCIMTGGWDKKLCFWDGKSSSPGMTIDIPEKFYCGDVAGELAVVGTADRKIQIYSLSNLGTPFRELESPLKFQSRCISCFPDKSGFAIGSIEGRIAIHHVNVNDNTKNFAFKCHRQDNNVYAINDIAFHPTFGTFATCGSDGTFHFWDKDSKQRLKAFKQCYLPITCGSFNQDGTLFAYGIGYDWCKGSGGFNTNTMRGHVFIHPTGEELKARQQNRR